ncbi:adenosine deaminase [Actinomycetaceae bacterium L2_0104]
MTARPMIDLHRHLEGTLRPSQLVEAARRSGLPTPTPRQIRERVVAPETVDSLRSYLTYIDNAAAYLRSLEDWRVAGDNAVQDAFDGGLDYVELRFSPWFISSQTGLDPNAVVEAIDDGIIAGSLRTGLPVGKIAIVVRDLGADSAHKQMDTILASPDVWCAVDMAGNEQGFALEDFAPAFARARDAGMHVTIHAGEAGGPENVRVAVTELGAERIGHGVRSAEDPELMELLAERGVTLETALTSNVQTAASPSLAEHQVHALLSAGVPVTLNTDNPTTSATDLRYEYRRGAVEAGLSPELLDLVARNAAQAAFTEAGRGLADF